MRHHFDTGVAEEVGIQAAVIFDNIAFWIRTNERNRRNIHLGKAWMYSSVSAFRDSFPYLSEKQIRNSISILLKNDFLSVGNFNKTKYDRTRWFCLTEKGNSFVRNQEKDSPVWANGKAKKGEPIPDRKTDRKANSKNRYIDERAQDFSSDPFGF